MATRDYTDEGAEITPRPRTLGPVDKRDSQIALRVIQSCSLGRAAMVRGLMTDEEWAFFGPFLIENRSHGGRPPADHRRVLDELLPKVWTGFRVI